MRVRVVLYNSYYRICGFGSFYIIVIIGYAGSGRERVLCRRVGLYVRMAGSAHRGCLEDQTRAGMNVQFNVCYNKKLSYNVVVGRGLHMLSCKSMLNQFIH